MNVKIEPKEDASSPERTAASILAAAGGTNTKGGESSSNVVAEVFVPDEIVGPPCGPLSETVTHERRWDTMFERLKAYKEKHGNCLVPNRYEEDTQLGSWVSAQRRQYKIVTSGGSESAAMTPDRANKLREIGFEWATTNPRNVPWETRFEELRKFVANYGHAEVPMRWEENPQLSNWVSKQRHQYKLLQSNRPSRLNQERVKVLNDIGFVWEASRRRLVDGTRPAGDDQGEDVTSPGGNRKKMKLVPKDKQGGLVDPLQQRKQVDAMPAFAEGKKGRFGMDPPAPMGAVVPGMMPAPGTLQFAQAAQQAMAQAAAGQAPGVVNPFGIWAAMAAGQAAAGGFMPPPPAVAAAAGAAMNPQFLMHMGAAAAMPFAAVPGMPPFGMPPPGVMQGLPQQQQQQQQQVTQNTQGQSTASSNNNDHAGDRQGGEYPKGSNGGQGVQD